jgi:hypothetical protein
MRIGCRLTYRLTQPTPLIATLNVHYSRFGDLERADYFGDIAQRAAGKLP